MEIKHIKQSDFENLVIKSNKTVLVDFYASWCGPCRMLAPILEQVKTEIGSKAEIYKLDIDEATELARTYGVMSIPTMIIFKDGEEKEKMIGLRQKSQIIEAINNHI